MKSSWMDRRESWLRADGTPQPADWSRSDATEQEPNLAEADHVDAEFYKLVDGDTQIGGKTLRVAEIVKDCDSQNLFEDADVLNQLHPKRRRVVASKMTLIKDASGRKVARAAQKAVERDRAQEEVAELSESWREYLNSALVKESKASVLAELQPGVAGKCKKVKK